MVLKQSNKFWGRMFSDDLGFRMFDFGLIEPGLCLIKEINRKFLFFSTSEIDIPKRQSHLERQKKNNCEKSEI